MTPGHAVYETWRAAVPEFVCNVPGGPWDELSPAVRAGFDAIAAQQPHPAPELGGTVTIDGQTFPQPTPPVEPKPAPGLRKALEGLVNWWAVGGNGIDAASQDLISACSAELLRVLDEHPDVAQPAPELTPGELELSELTAFRHLAQPAPELAMLQADLADAEALLARWPKCPAGCSCRIGIEDDPDRNECGCDGPCNGEEEPAPEVADALVQREQFAAQNELLTERLGLLEDGIGNLAAGLKLSATTSRPSKKSDIEGGVASALLSLLDPR